MKEKLSREQVEAIQQAADEARDEVLSQSILDVVMNATADDLVGANPKAEVTKGKAYRPGLWMHAPAHAELFAAADQRLLRVARLAGIATGTKVEKIHAKLIKGSRLVLIKPAATDDMTATEVTRYDGASGAWINLFDLLAQHGLTVETGWKVRYDIVYVPKGSPLWPGLLIDLDQPREKAMESAAKKKKEAVAKKNAAAKPAGNPETKQ